MWKFNVTSASASSWAVAYTVVQQPGAAIYGDRLPWAILSRSPNVRWWVSVRGSSLLVLFGTGRAHQASDRNVDTAHPRVQSFYGIIDANTGVELRHRGTRSSGRSAVATADHPGRNIGCCPDAAERWHDRQSDGQPARDEPEQRHSGTQRGWYLDLVSPANGYEGERSISDPILRAGEIIFTTAIPNSDPCAYGGRSWLMDMDSLSGGQLSFTRST